MRVVATILDIAGLLKGKQRLLVNLCTGDRCEKLKRKPQLKLELGGPEEGSLTPYHSSSITANRKRQILHLQWEDVFYLLPQQRGDFLLAWQQLTQ